MNPGLPPPGIEFRPLKRSDQALLADWLRRPHVAQWWRERSDQAAVEATYGALIDGSDPTEGFIAVRDGAGHGERQGQPLAFPQRYRLDHNPEWQRAVAHALGSATGPGTAGGGSTLAETSAGIDYFIGDQTMRGVDWVER